MKLNELKDNEGARHNRKRVGRGLGSGTGKTAGRGYKGQKSRTGVAIKGFEGGQMPIHRRLPKRGFNNNRRVVNRTVNLGELQRAFDAGKLDSKATIDASVLERAGLIRAGNGPVKLLAKGELTAKLNLTVCKASEAARTAFEKAGGKLSVLAIEDAKAE